MAPRQVALITGVGRRIGIGSAIAKALARDGFDIAYTYWSRYDESMPWGADPEHNSELSNYIANLGGLSIGIEADLSEPSVPSMIFDMVNSKLGPVAVLVLSHCESVDSSIMDTTLESFDRHFQVNMRASWLLIREFATRWSLAPDQGRIVALTSDHTAFNLPYGATKGGLDRIVLAAAHELSELGIRSNVINPGATDTGWMSPELIDLIKSKTALGRVGEPEDVANLVSFLCSPRGGWINGQHLYSNGGFVGGP
ncbi:SDR family oxidoreductase [Acidithrix ferrooxidans]|uniref:3-oxoacyl-[acyl-carrier-protein] reductase FabG n=1 Tax=Acidithrix ferrooxidans TaxID=1280514 RepID=A0A0D8HJJ0_9ACTN|nr:SDR family oxidoreductase [Acidithrix ferrooxidans]KJF18113.1 3-oxoacyl-[acyl-carrier-protein] reductase FabG [Acidithrix ferrooxidans]